MAKTVMGYFEQVSEAQRVLQDLLDHGFDRDQISLIAHQEQSGLEAGGNWAPRVISVPGRQPLKHDRRPLRDQPAGGVEGRWRPSR
jgi:hypothetical protein